MRIFMYFIAISLIGIILCWRVSFAGPVDSTGLTTGQEAELYEEERGVPSSNGFVAQYGLAKSKDTVKSTGKADQDTAIDAGEALSPAQASSRASGRASGRDSSVESSVPRIKVTKVPDYLYADASAWVPVSFEFEFVGSNDVVDIKDRHVDVTFSLKGFEQFTFSAPIAPDDGIGAYDRSKKFTAWVDINQFKHIDIAEDIIDDGVFTIKASYMGNQDTEWKDLKSDSDADKEGAKVKIFGDSNVKVVEIGLGSPSSNNAFSFFDEHTKQTRLHQRGTEAWKMIQQLGEGLGAPVDVTTANEDKTVFLHGRKLFGKKSDGLLNQTIPIPGYDFYVTNHVALGGDDFSVKTAFYGTQKGGGTPCRFKGGTLGAVLGCAYGVSYGHYESVAVLDGIKVNGVNVQGMNVADNSGLGHAYIAPQSTIVAEFQGATLGHIQ